MMRSIALPSSSSSLFESADPCRRPPYCSKIYCCTRSHVDIPKLEPFSRRKIDRCLKPPPPIEKAKKDITDYCLLLEGDECADCWQGYFELKQLERELPKDEVESLIRKTEGVKWLISSLHFLADMYKRKKEELPEKKKKNLDTSENGWMVKNEKIIGGVEERDCPVPDGLPRSEKEMEEEERSKMPDSPYTRLLRSKGKFPAWFTPRPDHETD